MTVYAHIEEKRQEAVDACFDKIIEDLSYAAPEEWELTKAQIRKRLDRMAAFLGREDDICSGCSQEIDPDTCGCGDSREDHGSAMNGCSLFVPMGCDCLRAPTRQDDAR